MQALVLAIVSCACATAYSTKTIEPSGTSLTSAVGGERRGEVRLVDVSGRRTGWMPAARLRVVGDALCLEMAHRAWADVDAIRISGLTDATIAGILVDLPEPIDVVHHMHGEIELRTRGQDLTRWLASRAHDPTDVDVPRYRVLAWYHLSAPLTWRELADAAHPMVGFALRDAVVELRRVDVGKTVLLGAAAATGALLVEALGWVQAAHLPESAPFTPREQHPRLRGGMVLDRAADVAPDAVTWKASACAVVSGTAP